MQAYQGKIFDADSHLYEKPDAWMRYMPENLKKELCIEHRVTSEGNLALFIGDIKVSTSEGYLKVGEHGERMIGRPGSLKEFLKALKSGEERYMFVPITEDQLTADARIAKLDEFGVEACVMYPGECTSIPAYFEDQNVLNTVLRGYNRYLEDEWKSFSYKGRINLTPIITFYDIDNAVAQVEWALKRGARAFVMPVGPVNGKSPADPIFDPIWARLSEAKAVVTYHIAEAGYMHVAQRQWGEVPLASRQRQTAWVWLNCFGEVPLTQTISSLIFYNLFERHPGVKILSAENGAEWVPALRTKMDKVRGMARGGKWPCGQLKERPSQIFDRNVYVVAYPEDNIKAITDMTGCWQNILMGSDYPHVEGVPTPATFAEHACPGLTEEQIRGVMYENGRRMLPAA